MSKRRATSDALSASRDELFAGEFEGLLIASQYDPGSILARLSPYLGGSASIVIYSQHLQVVADLQNKMRADSQYLAPSVTESWLRRYQVLPGRTHPTMVTSGSGGFLLHATKMYVLFHRPWPCRSYLFGDRYDDPRAQAVTSHRSKKRKTDASAGATPAETRAASKEPEGTSASVVEGNPTVSRSAADAAVSGETEKPSITDPEPMSL